MEQNLVTVQKIKNRYKFIDKSPKYLHTNIENLNNHKSLRKKEISYVMNLGKNSGNYLSPKTRPNNKYFESDLSYEDENINTYYKCEKSFLREMQFKIDEQKKEIRILKKVIYDKEKEINELNYELLLTQNELEDNLDSEEYHKLLHEYDSNINDYNNLKDDYNKLVDKYNILKEEKKKIHTDNKSLRRECNYIKEEMNKTLDEYNNIVEDYNQLKREYNNKNNKENNTDEASPNLIKDNNNDIIYKLQEENKKLREDNQNLSNKFKILKEEKEKIDNDYNNIILELKELKKQNEGLNQEIKKIKNEQIPKDIEFNNLCDDYEKLKQELNNAKIDNLQLKNDLLKLKENNDIIIGDNNPINAEENLLEEIMPKKVNFSEESKSRALERIKKMKEKQKEEKEKNKLRKSLKVSNIVKALEETMRKQNNDNEKNNGQ